MTSVPELVGHGGPALRELYRGRPGDSLALFDHLLSQVDPLVIFQNEERIRRQIARSTDWVVPSKGGLSLGTIGAREARVLMLSANGRLREAAVRAYLPRPDDAAGLALLCIRTNDWVRPIREIAGAMVDDAVAQASGQTIRALMPGLLQVASGWTRGEGTALAAFKQHPDWQGAAVTAFLAGQGRRMAPALRTLLRLDTLDAALPDLARNAQLPSIRAIAAETILTGRARWADGRRKVWIDKPLNQFRMEPAWQERPVAIDPATRDAILLAAAQDRAVGVRRTAADAVIRLGLEAVPAATELLARDPSRTVARRMEFARRKWTSPQS